MSPFLDATVLLQCQTISLAHWLNNTLLATGNRQKNEKGRQMLDSVVVVFGRTSGRGIRAPPVPRGNHEYGKAPEDIDHGAVSQPTIVC